jgi:hypothetical protein
VLTPGEIPPLYKHSSYHYDGIAETFARPQRKCFASVLSISALPSADAIYKRRAANKHMDEAILVIGG